MLTEPRGFTLVEMVLAMLLTVWFGGVVTALLIGTEIAVLHQRGRIELDRTTRGAVLFLGREVAGLATGPDSDVYVMAPDRLHYRGSRGLAFACGATGDTLLVRERLQFRVRSWQPTTDSLRVFVFGDTARGSVDRWQRLPLVSVSGGRCPDGALGLALETRFPWGFSPATDLAPGAPVQVFEPTEIRRYQSGGRWWFGLRSLSGGGSIQPALGPLSASGLDLEFLDPAGLPTADPRLLAAVIATVRAESSGEIRRGRGHAGGVLADSQSVLIALRNHR